MAPNPAQLTTMSSDPNASRAARIAPSTWLSSDTSVTRADRAIAELAGCGIECFRIQIAEQHARASFDERRRDRFADARSSAGHDRAFALQRSCMFNSSKMPAEAGRFAC